MFYLKRTNQEVPAPLGLVDRLHAFRSESYEVAKRAAHSFHEEHRHHVTVEERKEVYTTQTLDEAIKAGNVNDTAATHATTNKTFRDHNGRAVTVPEHGGPWPGREAIFNEPRTVQVGDHTPEPRATFADRVTGSQVRPD